MRERFLAVGCGGLALLSSALFIAVTGASVWSGERNAWIGWALAAVAGVMALAAFAVAIRRTNEDEDLFEGDRGLAVAMTMIVVIAVGILTLVFYLDPDFWRGALGQ
jgi:heme/copper-type cytochrome/quinol oxidase subunit 2